MPSFVLAADIGGSKIAAARVSDGGRITHHLAAPTPTPGGIAVVEAVVALLSRLSRTGVLGLGVDVPGLTYPDGHVWAPNISGWKKMPLGRILRREFGLPVLVESDRNAFVVGEAWRGAARNRRDVVFVAVGTGIGAGILAGGRLLSGRGGLAGAVGWMAVRDEFLSEYKSVGCLEAHAAGPGIARAASRPFGRSVGTPDLVRMAKRGDEKAKQVLRRAGHYLGLGLANLVSTLNPEMIVVGGGVAGAGELLLAPARETMRRWAQPLATKQVRVVRSRLGGRAALLGVAKLTFDYCESFQTHREHVSVRKAPRK